jgi:hypothetical protein
MRTLLPFDRATRTPRSSSANAKDCGQEQEKVQPFDCLSSSRS